MIATILRLPKADLAKGDAHFARFIKETKGVAHSYQLEADDEIVVVTVWESEGARDSYMKSGLKQDIDRSYPGQKRSIYKVRASK